MRWINRRYLLDEPVDEQMRVESQRRHRTSPMYVLCCSSATVV
jgi:hypothetical protein